MPFEIRKTLFFVCPVCGEGYPLPDLPAQNTTLKCMRDACSGREVFSDPSRGRKPSGVPSASSEPAGAGKARQRVSITVASAIVINVALIMTIVLLLYLVPMVLYRCSEGEPPKATDGGSGAAPATENLLP